MTEQLTPEDLHVLARVAGIRMTERERANISQALGGFLAALRALPTARTTEPLPTLTPREGKE
ncbi:MAG TPA: hypothetical protein VFT63_02130 [bacterium]|nr:hypothetical protein [bacterium]